MQKGRKRKNPKAQEADGTEKGSTWQSFKLPDDTISKGPFSSGVVPAEQTQLPLPTQLGSLPLSHTYDQIPFLAEHCRPPRLS